MDATLLATESGITNQNQTNLDKMSNLIILNDGTILDSKYEIIREIARGGMGIVYEAYNIHNYKTVAIKMILSDKIEPSQLKRFQKEIEAYSLLSHPNVIRIYDAGVYNNYPYIVMEYIKGVDICTYVKKYKEKDWKLCARLIYKTALGLEYIHSQKMIHRDIKPSNIIVRPNGSPVIIDLGLVKFNRSQSYNLTQSKEIVGTIEYMPIEQAQGKGGQIDVRTDVYSLGLVLYELLTGQRAYNGENLMELCYKIMSYYPPDPRKINPKIPEVLEEITLHAIEKQKEKRYTSMKTFATALKEYLNDTPAKTVSQYDKWIETNKDKIFSICIAVLLAIIFVIGMIIIVSTSNNQQMKQPSQNKTKRSEHIETSQDKKRTLVDKKDKKDNTTTESPNVTLDSENNQSSNYELLSERADKGNAEEKYKLGLMRYNGDGVKKDLEIAADWWQKATKQGHKDAPYRLALMYENGYDVIPKDFTKALFYFEKSANLGNAEAQLKLGYMYYDEIRDILQSIYWLNKAKESNNQEVSQEAKIKLKSIDEPILEYIEKLQNYEKVANNAQKQFNLGIMYENGYDVIAKDILGIIYNKKYDGIAKDIDQAVFWYAKAANQNHKIAQYNLGYMYENGQVVKRDIEKAISWYQKAANQDYVQAQCKLGDIYYNGQVVAQNLGMAKSWYEKAANQEDSNAQYKLGYMYESEKVQNLGMAKSWYEKAAKQGNKVAQYHLENILKQIQSNQDNKKY